MCLIEYRKMDSLAFRDQSIVETYHKMIDNQIKTLPKGTWQQDKNVIILIRYVLEIKNGLSKDDIPKINRAFIMENKLWGGA